MPVLIDISAKDHHLHAKAKCDAEKALGGRLGKSVDCVNIGLINNMPDSSLVSTERQLFDLLSAAAGKVVVRLHLYSMETAPRSDWGRDYTRRFYLGVKDLLNEDLDGVIVTGAEPKAASLTEEPYWRSFGQIIDWAKENTVSSIFSCLAVHGAVLHLDGVERRSLRSKCIGVFAQTKTADHALMQDVPLSLRIPHSRWNEVDEHALLQCGHTILTKSAEAGVDTFLKNHAKSLFVYFQGHPEYEAHSLLGEYRREIGRFLRRECEIYPTAPKGYFNKHAEESLIAFESKAVLDRRPELLTRFPADELARHLRNSWHLSAKRIYRNWLQYLSTHKARRLSSALADAV